MPIVPAHAQFALDRFHREFGHPASHLAIAPGRANLIGEHTDYQNGFVFPAAIDRYVCVAASLTDGATRIVSNLASGTAVFDARDPDPALEGWGRYPAGIAWALGGALNLEAAISADLPLGAGLSSSAALEMAFATLWRLLGSLAIDDAALARLGQKAENEFVGMKCGIMDQTASLFGQAGHALLIDTAAPGEPLPISLPADIELVVCDTRVKHELQGTEYNDRRSQVESAAAMLGVPTLRDASLAMVEHLPDPERRRARHVVTENARVLDFRTALEEGRRDAMSALMRASHMSLRDDYEVSCPELDAMAEAAWASPGCIGARMMGGGFGGSCIALVEAQEVESFTEAVSRTYRELTGIEPVVHRCHAVDGARAVAL